MPKNKRPPRVELVEASPARFVLDMGLGRVIVEPDSVRFHKNGRGRGVAVVKRFADGSARRPTGSVFD